MMILMRESRPGSVLYSAHGAAERVVEASINRLYYGTFLAVRDTHLAIEKGASHSAYRAFGQRQEHGAPPPEPDERPDSRIPPGGTVPSSGGTYTNRLLIRFRCGGTSG